MEYLIIGVIVVLGIAILFLKMFDRVAGRGPGQVSKGIREHDKGK